MKCFSSFFTRTGPVLLLVMVLIGCAKDDSTTTAGTQPSANSDTYLTANAEGEAFEVQGSLFAVDSDAGGVISTYMSASYDDDSKNISMGITNIDGVGTYGLLDPSVDDPVTSSYVSSFIYVEDDTQYMITSLSGSDSLSTIVITDISTEYLEGTFQFKGFNPDDLSEKEVTEGSFRFRRI